MEVIISIDHINIINPKTTNAKYLIFSISSLLDPFSYEMVTAEEEESVGVMSEISMGMSDGIDKLEPFWTPVVAVV